MIDRSLKYNKNEIEIKQVFDNNWIIYFTYLGCITKL